MFGRTGFPMMSNKYQRQTPFNQILMPVIQAVMVVAVVAAVVVDVQFLLYLLGELQTFAFFAAALVCAWCGVRWASYGLAAIGAYAWLSFFALGRLGLPAFAPWSSVRVVLVVVCCCVPVPAYHLVKYLITNIRFPNLADSVTAQRGKLREGNIRDTIRNEEDEDVQQFDW